MIASLDIFVKRFCLCVFPASCFAVVRVRGNQILSVLSFSFFLSRFVPEFLFSFLNFRQSFLFAETCQTEGRKKREGEETKMNWLQPKPTPQEAMKASKRGITRSQRDLDRDMRELERQEKQLIIQIKAFARKGDNHNARLHTKQLVTVRQTKEKIANMKGTLFFF